MKKISKLIVFASLPILFMGVSVNNPAPNLFSNLFGSNPDISSIITKIIGILLGLAGLVAILYVILGGFQWMTARGNDEQASSGRKTLTNAIIGLVIIILSYVIITVVANAALGKLT